MNTNNASFFCLSAAVLALMILLALPVVNSPAAEQKVPGARGSSGDSRQSIDKLPDLAIHYLGLTPAGSVIYQVVNSGKGSTQGPFVVDIYLNGVRTDTIRHGPLPGMSIQTVESNLARFSDCKEGTVRLVIDAQNTVREMDEKNNERIAQLTPPCPKAPQQ